MQESRSIAWNQAARISLQIPDCQKTRGNIPSEAKTPRRAPYSLRHPPAHVTVVDPETCTATPKTSVLCAAAPAPGPVRASPPRRWSAIYVHSTNHATPFSHESRRFLQISQSGRLFRALRSQLVKRSRWSQMDLLGRQPAGVGNSAFLGLHSAKKPATGNLGCRATLTSRRSRRLWSVS